MDIFSPIKLWSSALDELLSLLRDFIDPDPGSVTWSLASVDKGFDLNLSGDGEPDRVIVQAPSGVTQSAGWMTDRPATTPSSAGPRNLSVEHTFDSRDRTHNLRPVVAALEMCRRAAPELRRRPKLRFVYGSIDLTVWLQDYEATPFEGYWPGTENPKRLRITFSAVEAFTHKLRPAAQRPPETTWVKMPAGYTFELLAAERYGDPSLGVHVRRTNAAMYEETPGSLVRLLDREHPSMQAAVAPRAPAFTERYTELLGAKARTRLGRAGAAWADIAGELEVTDDAPRLW